MSGAGQSPAVGHHNDSVLVLGNFRQTITVVRSLGRAGYRVILGRHGKNGYIESSCHVSEVWAHPHLVSQEQEFIAALCGLLATRPDIQFVFPVGDTQAACIARHLARFARVDCFVMPDPAVVAACIDKASMYDRVTRLAIPSAISFSAGTYGELVAAIARVGYPCVAKPNSQHAGGADFKALILESREDVARLLPAWPEGEAAILVQNHVPGARHNCHFIATDGTLHSYFEQKVLRTDRIDGTGYGVEGMSVAPDARLRGYCEQLIANLGYSGAGCAQFLVDDVRSTVSFLEINPRLDATCAIPYYCGYDFPRMAVECVGHRLGMVSQVSRNLDEYTAGRVGVWLYGDLQGLLEAWRRKELSLKSALLWLGRMFGSFVRADFHLVWSWRDPLPAMVLYAHLPAALVSRGAGKLRSLLGRIPLPGRRSPY